MRTRRCRRRRSAPCPDADTVANRASARHRPARPGTCARPRASSASRTMVSGAWMISVRRVAEALDALARQHLLPPQVTLVPLPLAVVGTVVLGEPAGADDAQVDRVRSRRPPHCERRAGARPRSPTARAPGAASSPTTTRCARRPGRPPAAARGRPVVPAPSSPAGGRRRVTEVQRGVDHRDEVEQRQVLGQLDDRPLRRGHGDVAQPLPVPGRDAAPSHVHAAPVGVRRVTRAARHDRQVVEHRHPPISKTGARDVGEDDVVGQHERQGTTGRREVVGGRGELRDPGGGVDEPRRAQQVGAEAVRVGVTVTDRIHPSTVDMQPSRIHRHPDGCGTSGPSTAPVPSGALRVASGAVSRDTPSQKRRTAPLAEPEWAGWVAYDLFSIYRLGIDSVSITDRKWVTPMRSNDFSQHHHPSDRRRGRHNPDRGFGGDLGFGPGLRSRPRRPRSSPRTSARRPRRRRPRRRPAPAGRAAPARLPADPGDRREERGVLDPQPRLDLPRAAAARGRGPDLVRARRRPQDRDPHPRGHGVRRRAPRRARHALGGRQGRPVPRDARVRAPPQGLHQRLEAGRAGRHPRAAREGQRGRRRRPQGHVPDPRGRRVRPR